MGFNSGFKGLKTNLVLYHDIALQIRTHLSHMEFELYIVRTHELQFMRTHIRVIRFPGNYVSYWRWPIYGRNM